MVTSCAFTVIEKMIVRMARRFFIVFEFFNVFPSPSGKQVYKKSVELKYLISDKSNKGQNEKKS